MVTAKTEFSFAGRPHAKYVAVASEKAAVIRNQRRPEEGKKN